MRETRLGEFEEVILLLVGILGEEAYGYRIAEEFESQTKRSTSIGAVHSTLVRLDEKGFLTSKMGKSTPERGGRRKRIYTITASGQRVLKSARDFRVSLWSQFPTLSVKVSGLPQLVGDFEPAPPNGVKSGFRVPSYLKVLVS